MGPINWLQVGVGRHPPSVQLPEEGMGGNALVNLVTVGLVFM